MVVPTILRPSSSPIPTAGLGWAGRGVDALDSGGNVTSWPGFAGTGTATIVGTPTKVSNRIVCGTSNGFALPSTVVAAGEWTMYGVISARAAGTRWLLFSQNSGGSAGGVIVDTDNRLYVVDDAGNSNAVPSSTISNLTTAGVMRVRRNAAAQIYCRITGQSEGALTGAALGTISMTNVTCKPNVGRWTDAATPIEFAAMYTTDTVTAGTDAALMAWITATYGVGF